MNPNQWTSKREIFNDLAEVSGSRLHAALVPVMDRPPVSAIEENYEDEMQYYFGNDSTNISSTATSLRDVHVNCPPDQDGILDLLDMVRVSDCGLPDYNEPALPESSHSSALLITKTPLQDGVIELNPNVKEFVPSSQVMGDRNNNGQNTMDEKNISRQHAVTENDTEKPTVTPAAQSSNAVKVISNKRLDPATLQPDEVDSIAKELKTEFKKMTLKKSPQSRLLRNAALASLTKLYSVTSLEPQLTTEPPVTTEPLVTTEPPVTKLLTPDYFQASGEPHVTQNCKQEEQLVKDLDPCIKESIDKVEQWQQNIEKGVNGINSSVKSAASFKPQLTPFTYKRKPKSVTPVTEDSRPAALSSTSSNSSIKVFVPSSKASEFYEQITKECARRDELKENIWDKIQREMREKNEQIKKQKAEQDQ